MCKCDTCKIEQSIMNSNEPGCCAWYMDNVVIGGLPVDRCPVYKPIDELQRVWSKSCSSLSGYVLRWISPDQFVAYVTNKYGTSGEMICHKDSWHIT